MEKIIPADILYKIIVFVGGLVGLVYANKFHIGALKHGFREERREVRRELEAIKGKIDEIRTTQVRNCTNVEHLQKSVEGIEKRCFEHMDGN